MLLALIGAYQATFGRLFGGNCRFHPSCSDFAADAVRLNGSLIGGGQALYRIVRCGPWSRGGVDHPKPRRTRPQTGGVRG
ncbi:MAG: membrane protein insertion efficiency factor YidD [Actinomycetota bacterium]